MAAKSLTTHAGLLEIATVCEDASIKIPEDGLAACEMLVRVVAYDDNDSVAALDVLNLCLGGTRKNYCPLDALADRADSYGLGLVSKHWAQFNKLVHEVGRMTRDCSTGRIRNNEYANFHRLLRALADAIAKDLGFEHVGESSPLYESGQTTPTDGFAACELVIATVLSEDDGIEALWSLANDLVGGSLGTEAAVVEAKLEELLKVASEVGIASPNWQAFVKMVRKALKALDDYDEDRIGDDKFSAVSSALSKAAYAVAKDVGIAVDVHEAVVEQIPDDSEEALEILVRMANPGVQLNLEDGIHLYNEEMGGDCDNFDPVKKLITRAGELGVASPSWPPLVNSLRELLDLLAMGDTYHFSVTARTTRLLCQVAKDTGIGVDLHESKAPTDPFEALEMLLKALRAQEKAAAVNAVAELNFDLMGVFHDYEPFRKVIFAIDAIGLVSPSWPELRANLLDLAHLLAKNQDAEYLYTYVNIGKKVDRLLPLVSKDLGV